MTQMRVFIATHRMIARGAPVVVAVSGGPDSLCLLHALVALRDELDITLHVAHLDHMIRGAEAASEAAFVADIARRWGLQATVEAIDVPALARRTGANQHAAARHARYAFLARVALAVGAQAVAVAHHAGDQAETVLLHLLRGAGPEGLRGMRPVVRWEDWGLGVGSWGLVNELQPLTPSPQPLLVRPLLEVTRDAIERYCAEHGLEPRRDPTNRDLGATRNRIRHDLLPRLIEYNPHIVAALGRTAALCAEEQAFTQAALDAAWPNLVRERAGAVDFAGPAWQELRPALQREAIRRAHARLAQGEMLELEHVERARELIGRGVGRRIDLPGGVPLIVGYGGAFTIGAPPESYGPQLAGEELALPREGRVALGDGWAIEIARVAPPAPRPGSEWEVYLDTDALAGPLLARRRRPGDRIRLASGGRRLQDLFVDAKVPRALRDTWPVIATPSAVAWVVGLRAAEVYAATSASQRIISIRVVRDMEPF